MKGKVVTTFPFVEKIAITTFEMQTGKKEENFISLKINLKT